MDDESTGTAAKKGEREEVKIRRAKRGDSEREAEEDIKWREERGDITAGGHRPVLHCSYQDEPQQGGGGGGGGGREMRGGGGGGERRGGGGGGGLGGAGVGGGGGRGEI